VALYGGALAAISACASLASPDLPKEYLDQQTAATITTVGRPMVLARDPREQPATDPHDYLTVAAAAVDRSGIIEYVLIVYPWLSLYESKGGASERDIVPLTLAADERRITLPLQGRSAQETGLGTPVHAPFESLTMRPYVYRTDLATLRILAEASHITVLSHAEDMRVAYVTMYDERASLRALVEQLSRGN
jgi:hypothetical protein